MCSSDLDKLLEGIQIKQNLATSVKHLSVYCLCAAPRSGGGIREIAASPSKHSSLLARLRPSPPSLPPLHPGARLEGGAGPHLSGPMTVISWMAEQQLAVATAAAARALPSDLSPFSRRGQRSATTPLTSTHTSAAPQAHLSGTRPPHPFTPPHTSMRQIQPLSSVDTKSNWSISRPISQSTI